MDTYRTKWSETSPVREIELADGRKIKKLIDKSLLRKRSQKQSMNDPRNYIQLLFFLVTIWIGLDFCLFVSDLGHGVFHQRPPGVEGFLPIGALMSFRYFIATGIINNIHPSGLFIFIGVILVSTLLKKGFCSWICPVGYVSESLYQFRKKIFKKKLLLPRWLDIPLRTLKYILMAFFLIAVSTMSAVDLYDFIHSDYNKVADIKMYMFFAHIAIVPLAVIGILFLLSLVYENFWCRYACPYGALLGIASLFSPFKVHRVEQTCIDCGKCAEVCPSILPVDKLDVVRSAECTGCYSCIEACPVKDTLKFSIRSNLTGLSQKRYGLVILSVYFGIVGIAMMLGLWQNSISASEYAQLFQRIGSVVHPF